MAAYATYFRDHYGADTFENDVLRHPMSLSSGPCLASVRSSGSMDFPRLEVMLRGPQLGEAAIQEARARLSVRMGSISPSVMRSGRPEGSLSEQRKARPAR